MPELIAKQKETRQLVQDSLKQAMSYDGYRALVGRLVREGKSTGAEQTGFLADYTMLNDRRMNRLDKTLKIDEESAAKIKLYDRKVIWLVLTESWCGDAAQSLPVMNKMAELCSNIVFKVILRDEHLELMNRFLYEHTLSIPKLIIIDKETGKVIGDWGPRPSEAAKMVAEFKLKQGALTPEFKEELQVWYNKDKGRGILKDLTGLLLK